MNKTAIKNFAIWARNKLIADISYRAGLMGITADRIYAALPQSTGQTEFYDIGTAEPYAITGTAIRQRKHLAELIQRKERDSDYKTAYKYIIEEVAYTWFNRLIAVRFMEVNDYLPSHIRVLSSESGKLEPDLVTMPFDADLEFTNAEQKTIIALKNDNKLDEVFRMLFIKQCNAFNEILPALFEKTNDYTELLLNLSVIDQDGVVYHLVHDIPEEDFDVERGGQVEIIGWLYQYYNTEPKNDAFAKKGKISKEEVPAVTQLFTPDWIVRYMVENSLGRLWVEGHPNDDLKAGWKYYLEEAEQESEVQAELAEIRAKYAKLNPEDIKMIDPCMGSGHILVYAFDVLMQIYESAGYGQRDAARSILENNLYGLDIDDRAFQMAYFAIMMKARQYNRRILNGKYKPNLYSIQESNNISRNQLQYFGAGLSEQEKNNAIMQLRGLLDAFKDAKEYGSILTIDPYDWDLLDRFVSSTDVIEQMSMDTIGLDDTAEKLNQLTAQGRVLAQKYHVTTTNPPYMGAGNMNSKLNDYIRGRYYDYKADFFSVFIARCMNLTLSIGRLGFLTPYVWMFILAYEKLREEILGSKTLTSLIQFEYSSFEEAIVPICTFTFLNSKVACKGVYIRLTDFKGGMEVQRKKTLEAKHNHQCGYYYEKYSDDFSLVPGAPFAYWQNDQFFRDFSQNKDMSAYVDVRKGLTTADNNKYIRVWWEVDVYRTNLVSDGISKWFRTHKGGDYRKWYGNSENLVDWENDGFALKNFKSAVIRNEQYYLRECISWNDISSAKAAFRWVPQGSISNASGPSYYGEQNIMMYLLGLCNSVVSDTILSVLCPTIHFEIGQIAKVPVIIDADSKEEVLDIVRENIEFSKEDWDSFENSWDFERHPLAPNCRRRGHWNTQKTTIEECFKAWSAECNRRFEQLKSNEEKLNQIFINIYGLQDELTSEIEDKDVTVRSANLQRDIKSLLSYAVGCMFGRYSLETTGLIFAGGKWDEGKYGQFQPDADNVIPITDEEYLEDDIVSRLCTFLKIAFGERTLEENLEYIAKALDNRGDSSRNIIRNYFMNDFFKDHCQNYSVTGSGKRPIYWLFDSGKQNGFKALIYLHRYNADTIGNLRIDYLHRIQRIYESEISRTQDMIDHSISAREAAQATKRREKLQKQLKECREYDEKLAHLALSRIELDLDDGVKVNYRKLQTANDGKFYEVLADSKNIMAKK